MTMQIAGKIGAWARPDLTLDMVVGCRPSDLVPIAKRMNVVLDQSEAEEIFREESDGWERALIKFLNTQIGRSIVAHAQNRLLTAEMKTSAPCADGPNTALGQKREPQTAGG